MIAAAGAWRLARGERSGAGLEPYDSLPLPGLLSPCRLTRSIDAVYPLNIHLGPVQITGYGIMMMVSFLIGGWLIALELRRQRPERGLLRRHHRRGR